MDLHSLYTQIIGVCWLVFFAAWAILAIVFGWSLERGSSSRAAGVWLSIVIIILGLRYSGRLPARMPGTVVSDMAAAGAVFCVVGLVFATWARVVLGRYWGMPMARHTAPELVTSGPYRYVRHPIYTGLIAMWIGTALVYPVTAPAGLVITVYCLISARREERDMEQRFPETYPEYRKRSKMLLPFLI